ncbi:MAG: hypothetical protein HYX78_12220 [Armatimonadetes bacterium]|nr:hypothetical protein [Armatimonadota bacterium]
MFRLRIDWCEACQGCGTEIAVDVSNETPEACACPWCGSQVSVTITDKDREALGAASAAAADLESRLNSQLISHET